MSYFNKGFNSSKDTYVNGTGTNIGDNTAGVIKTISIRFKLNMNNIEKIKQFFAHLSPLNIILIGALGITLVVYLSNLHRNTLHDISTAELAPEKVYVDMYGDHHVLLKTIEANKAEIDGLKHSDALKGLQIKKLDHLLSVTKATSVIDTEFITVPSIDDSCNFFIEKKDAFIHLWAKGNKTTGTIGLKSIDSITIVQYKKFHLFKANETKIDIKNSSPYTEIVSGKSIVLKEKKILVSLGIQIGMNPINYQPYYGIGIQFNLLPILKK